jgi:hypothetical protein
VALPVQRRLFRKGESVDRSSNVTKMPTMRLAGTAEIEGAEHDHPGRPPYVL